MKKIKSILFVCTGNSCRSVMAEGLLKKYLSEQKRVDIQVRSCGIVPLSGMRPTENTLKVMKKEEVDVSDHRSHRLTRDIIDTSDLILTMEKIHKDEVINLLPQAKDKVYLLKEFVGVKQKNKDFSVPDPISMPLEVYERVLGMIKEAVQKLMEKI